MGLWKTGLIIYLTVMIIEFPPLVKMQPQLFAIYKRIEEEIFQKFHTCSSLTFILEIKSKHFVEYPWSARTHRFKSISKEDAGNNYPQMQYGTNLILELDEIRKNLTLKDIPYIFKLHHTCSIVLYNINNFLDLDETELEAAGNFWLWQDQLLKNIPNSRFSFFIFFTSLSDASEKLRLFSKISNIARFTLYIVLQKEGGSVYRTNPGLEKILVPVACYKNGELQEMREFLPNPPENFGGQIINVVVCPICNSAWETFKETGIWEDAYMAVTYEALKPFNVTLETSSALGIPKGDQNEDGEWDEFTTPLIDESAAVSTVIKPTILKAEVIYMTKEYMYDSAIFITAPPLKTKFGSISVLKDPLENEVWVVFTISITSMLVALQGIIYFRTGKLSWGRMIQIILYPIIDQMSFTHRSRDNFSSDRVVNIMTGIWFLCLIVLACAYKSKLISAIVCPHYIARPQTFAELAASNYKIGIVFYTGFLENDFQAMNTSVNAEIVRRGVEFDYIAEDCYQNIFEGDQVCLGYTMAMEAIGGEFLVDANGQKMYSRSKDTHFQGFMMLGVSKYYPMFLDPINFYLSISDNVGLTRFYTRYFQQKVKNKGKENAMKWRTTKKYYAGTDNYNQEEEEDQRFSAILKKLLFHGMGCSIFVFFAEAAANYLVKYFNRGRVIELSDVNDRVFQRAEYLNRNYLDEFLF